MNQQQAPSVVPDAAVLIEYWERAAAGRDTDALAPSCGLLTSLSIGIPIDILLLLWVLV